MTVTHVSIQQKERAEHGAYIRVKDARIAILVSSRKGHLFLRIRKALTIATDVNLCARRVELRPIQRNSPVKSKYLVPDEIVAWSDVGREDDCNALAILLSKVSGLDYPV